MMYAYITDGIVYNIIVADSSWVAEQSDSENYVHYTDENQAFVGGPYIDGVFYEPQPYPSWTLDTSSARWVPPVPKPISNTTQPDEPDFSIIEKYYSWDEASLSWYEDPDWVYVPESKHFIYSPSHE